MELAAAALVGAAWVAWKRSCLAQEEEEETVHGQGLYERSTNNSRAGVNQDAGLGDTGTDDAATSSDDAGLYERSTNNSRAGVNQDAGLGDTGTDDAATSSDDAGLLDAPPPRHRMALMKPTVPQSFTAVRTSFAEAKVYTDKVLAKRPVNAEDPAVLPHILKAMAGPNQLVTFGQHGGNQHLGDVGAEDEGWNMVLDNPPNWCGARTNAEVLELSETRTKFKEEASRRIAKSLGVPAERVVILELKLGSISLKFTVQDLTPEEKDNILKKDCSGNLRKQFNTFQTLRISPAVLHLHFDLDMLDNRGNKTFSQGGAFQVGPKGRERTYHQPTNWTRYGLKALGGKYGADNTWLDPFQHAGNWYRAFHGVNKQDTIARIIALGGFKESSGGKLGAGVYVSPFSDYALGYSKTLTLQTQSGWQKFMYILQVAVDPACVMKEGYPNASGENQEWTVKACGVRPYGLLIREA